MDEDSQTLGATFLCEALLNPHVLTCVPSFPQSYFSWCHYRFNILVTRQKWSTCDKMFFGNHCKSFSHLTRMPNEAILSESQIWLLPETPCLSITLHNITILKLIKVILHKFSPSLAHFRMPFKGLQKLMGSTESNIKLNQNFPTKKKYSRIFFSFS